MALAPELSANNEDDDLFVLALMKKHAANYINKLTEVNFFWM